MKKILFEITLLVLIIGLLLSACTPAATPEAVSEEVAPAEETVEEEAPPAEVAKVLKVGVLAPFTGPSSRVGEEFKYSVTMAFDAIDWTVGDYKIEAVWIDGESDPEKATRAYEAAITRDGINVGLLNWDASEVIPLMDLAAKYEVPHFFAMGTSEDIDIKYLSDEKYTFWMGKGWPTPSKLTINYVNALEDAITRGLWSPTEKKVVLYGNDDEWSRGFTKAIGAQLVDAGWEIVDEEYIPIGETDFYPMLTKIKSLDVPLMAGTMDDAAGFPAMIKQAREKDLKCLIVADGLGWVGEWYDMTGDASDYVIDQIPGWATEKAVAFKDEFTERWGIEPSPSSAGLAFDEANFFIKVLQQTYQDSGELTSASVYKTGKEKMMTGELTYTDGILMQEYKFLPETMPDMVVGEGYFVFPVIQYFGGAGKTIWPGEIQEQDMQVP
ncbi:MAG: ABC transporter substrate-binding protein [Anaerolineales bacterium]|nr:ABC transporter substrate-binding protein [Anaerolineales bacterium]